MSVVEWYLGGKEFRFFTLERHRQSIWGMPSALPFLGSHSREQGKVAKMDKHRNSEM